MRGEEEKKIALKRITKMENDKNEKEKEVKELQEKL